MNYIYEKTEYCEWIQLNPEEATNDDGIGITFVDNRVDVNAKYEANAFSFKNFAKCINVIDSILNSGIISALKFCEELDKAGFVNISRFKDLKLCEKLLWSLWTRRKKQKTFVTAHFDNWVLFINESQLYAQKKQPDCLIDNLFQCFPIYNIQNSKEEDKDIFLKSFLERMSLNELKTMCFDIVSQWKKENEIERNQAEELKNSAYSDHRKLLDLEDLFK